MCGIFGFLNYSKKAIKSLSNLTNSLAVESAQRGTDATGISFVSDNEICILKDSKSAYSLTFKHSDNITALIGHTRHSTQSDCKYNENNHPFPGKCNNAAFSLVHNGVLLNDKELKFKYHFPKTKIKTDSYVAVQLLEYKKNLSPDSIKFMAENVEGSYSFSILDDKNNIWLVKGDSPLEILRFPSLKLIVYASTELILWRAILETNLFDEIKSGRYEKIDIDEGDILRISPNGKISRFDFKYNDFTYANCNWWDYTLYTHNDCTSDYIDSLKTVAQYQGYSSEEIDLLLQNGFTPEEIEEYIYCVGEV